MAAAWNAAQGGDTIIAKGGTYSSGFSASGAKSSVVTIKAASGENPWFAGDGSLSGVSNMAVTDDRPITDFAKLAGRGSGLTVGELSVGGGSSNVTFTNIDAYCQNQSPWHMVNGQSGSSCDTSVVISDVNGFTWTGGSIGPIAACSTSPCSGGDNTNKITACSSNAACTNITFRGVVFHDVLAFDSNDHQEAFKIDQGSNILFQNNIFLRCKNCNSATVFFGQSGSKDTADNVTFIGNIIGPAEGGGAGLNYAYNAPSGRATHLTFRYNSVDGTLNFSGPYTTGTLPGTNITLEGNTAWKQSYQGCISGATYTKNTWYASGGTAPAQCGTDNGPQSTSSGFWVSPGSPNYDYHLATKSPLIGTGGTGCSNLTDIYGDARPAGAVCDVGADESGSGPTVALAPPTNLTVSVH